MLVPDIKYVSITAVIGGVTVTDITSFQSNFATNSIPTAMLGMAVGLNLQSNKRAQLHELKALLRKPQHTQVFFSFADARGLPEKPVLIFDGETRGTGWQRQRNSLIFTISLEHWLGELNYASSVSATNHPGNPVDFSYPAIVKQLGIGSSIPGAGVDGINWVPIPDSSIVSQASLSDIWENVFKQWLTTLAAQDPLDLAGRNTDGNAANLADIALAVSRLKAGSSPDAVALEVDTRGADSLAITDGISAVLRDEVLRGFATTTLWGKIINEWSSEFCFDVVPRVTDALIVPSVGALRGGDFRSIPSTDILQGTSSGAVDQKLRAICMTHPMRSATMFNTASDIPVVDCGGCFGWFEGSESGVIMVKETPTWLSQVDALSTTNNAEDSEGYAGNVVTTSLDAVQPRSDVAAQKTQTQLARESVQSMANRYAEQRYVIEQLRTRTAEILGPLRFDIAPGSHIKVEVTETDAAVNAGLDILEPILGRVYQVNTLIDASNNSAFTAINLCNVRGVNEDTEPGKSVVNALIYKNTWKGACLVPELPNGPFFVN